jgi:hypothetical protein
MSEMNPQIGQAGAGGQAQPQQQQMQVQLREDKAHVVYSNVCRLFGGPNAEELVVDFAITTPAPDRQDVMNMDVNARVIMNYFAAKRLALALSQAVQRYEQQFGAIELDPRRRLKQA